jgi:hypothetical protein
VDAGTRSFGTQHASPFTCGNFSDISSWRVVWLWCCRRKQSNGFNYLAAGCVIISSRVRVTFDVFATGKIHNEVCWISRKLRVHVPSKPQALGRNRLHIQKNSKKIFPYTLYTHTFFSSDADVRLCVCIYIYMQIHTYTNVPQCISVAKLFWVYQERKICVTTSTVCSD